MSAADEAWEKWRTRFGQYTIEGDDRESFMAGYRRALEDAADAIETLDENAAEEALHVYRGDCAAVFEYAARKVRARAAAVAPRETKD